MSYIMFREERTWKFKDELSEDCLCFAIENKKDKRVTLVKDKDIYGMYNIHFCWNGLSETEKQMIVVGVNEFVKKGEYIGSCGDCCDDDVNDFNRFYFDTTRYEETHCVRTLINKENGEKVYLPILRRI